ncbi:hypothetical protein EYF80_058328 [Liparis tanakae]|uniref:Uncharacterized protein n=1 Tax=Liparis tanakae TaxID=230148 RepID=A0A4Z2ERS9_9TELE|nr:hypothetical protein EYF80_058328 [Liparis tanakae]
MRGSSGTSTLKKVELVLVSGCPPGLWVSSRSLGLLQVSGCPPGLWVSSRSLGVLQVSGSPPGPFCEALERIVKDSVTFLMHETRSIPRDKSGPRHTSLDYNLPVWTTTYQSGLQPTSLDYNMLVWTTTYQSGLQYASLDHNLPVWTTRC